MKILIICGPLENTTFSNIYETTYYVYNSDKIELIDDIKEYYKIYYEFKPSNDAKQNILNIWYQSKINTLGEFNHDSYTTIKKMIYNVMQNSTKSMMKYTKDDHSKFNCIFHIIT